MGSFIYKGATVEMPCCNVLDEQINDENLMRDRELCMSKNRMNLNFIKTDKS